MRRLLERRCHVLCALWSLYREEAAQVRWQEAILRRMLEAGKMRRLRLGQQRKDEEVDVRRERAVQALRRKIDDNGIINRQTNNRDCKTHSAGTAQAGQKEIVLRETIRMVIEKGCSDG